MPLIDYLGENIRNVKSNKRVSAVVLSAGSGTRMNCGSINKNLILLNNKPVIVYSLEELQKSEYIYEIILVVKKEEINNYQQLINDYKLDKVIQIVPGGLTRQESSELGFNYCSEKCSYVLFHDGDRPFISQDIIKNTVLNAYEYKAVTAAEKVINTIKESNISDYVVKTLDRTKLWSIQTPQVFYSNLYRASLYVAGKNGFKATDDCSIVENAGFNVKLLECSRNNIKITTEFDLLLAQAILGEKQ